MTTYFTKFVNKYLINLYENMLSDEQILQNLDEILQDDDSNDEFMDNIVEFDELVEQNTPGNYFHIVCSTYYILKYNIILCLVSNINGYIYFFITIDF